MADPVNVQFQVRQNSEELQDFLKDLYKWEKDVQTKDQLLANSTSVSSSLPPVRNKTLKKRPKTKQQKHPANSTSKIEGFDFKAWDKYNVDEALKEIDEKEEMQTQSTSEEDTDDELAEQRILQQALFDKEKGNDLFKEGKYEAAINRYTTAIRRDPYNAILPANRAMALIKVRRYGAAIQDCGAALALDSTYVKAYARRATANLALGRQEEAMNDYKRLLELYPGNKLAMEGMEKIQQKMAKETTSNATAKKDTIKDKSAEKPMKRYVIEEIGAASNSDEDDVGDKMTREASKTTSENQTALERENSTMAISSAKKTTLSRQDAGINIDTRPVKTVTENLKTTDDQIRANKPTTEAPPLPEGSKSSTPATMNIDLTPPVSSIQFETTWKRLEKYPDLLYKYMKGIPPERLPKVIGESVESTLLFKILSTIRQFYVRDRLPIFTELRYISEVKRFSMTLMFLSDKEKTVIKDLFEYLRKFPDDERSYTEEDLCSLRHKYGVR